MTTEQKARINRAVAESLGWTVEKMQLMWWIKDPCGHVVEDIDFEEEITGSKAWPDYFTDEAASATLLEAMQEVYLVHSSKSNEWECAANVWPTSFNTKPNQFDPDRRTAILMAYCAWKEIPYEL